MIVTVILHLIIFTDDFFCSRKVEYCRYEVHQNMYMCIGYNRGKGFSTKRHFSLMTQSSTVLHCIMVFYRVKVILYCVSHLAVCVQPCR